MSVEQITKAGDVKIEEVTIVSLNGAAQTITPQVMGIDIYEDLFGTFMSGKVHVKDSQELSSLLPLIGEEVIRIHVRTPAFKNDQGYIGEFYIYKMDDVTKNSEREIIYTLHFISKEFITNLNKNISRGMSGVISDIAKNILSADWSFNTKKKLNVEPTQNKTKYVSNFWSPLENILYLTNTAVNMKGIPSYLFFENKYGLNFVSLDSLYAVNEVFQKFIWDNYNAEVNSLGGSQLSLEKDYQRILDIFPSTSFDYIKRLKDGLYGSELITYDMVTKQYTHTAFKPDFSQTNHLNPNPIWTENSATSVGANVTYMPKYYNNFDGYDDVTNAKTILARRSLLAQAEGYKVTITVWGRTDYSVGKKVYLEIPKNSQIKSNDTNWDNKINSGNYIISAICHNITRESHKCVIELSKDSYMVNLNDTK